MEKLYILFTFYSHFPALISVSVYKICIFFNGNAIFLCVSEKNCFSLQFDSIMQKEATEQACRGSGSTGRHS